MLTMFKRAAWTCSLLLLFACAAIPNGKVAFAGDGTAGSPIVVPTDENNETSAEGDEGASWINPKTDDATPPKPIAHKFRLKQKSHWVGSGKHEVQPRAVKITKITYTDDQVPPVEHTVDVSAVSSGGSVANPDNTSDISVAQIETAVAQSQAPPPTHKVDWTKKIKITYEHRGANGQASGTDKPVEVNWLAVSDLGKEFVSIETGPGATIWCATAAQVTMLEFLEARALSPETFEAPDLMFYSHSAPKVGDVRFVPLGQFSFTSVPEAVRLYDGEGTVLDTEHGGSVITLGNASLSSKGELVIPITDIDSAPDDFVMIVRGAEITLEDDAEEGGTQCYTVGGSALQHLTADAAAVANSDELLDNWEIQPWTPAFSLATADVPVWDSEEEEVVNQRVGKDRPLVVVGEDNSGFLSALVIKGASAGAIDAGVVTIRPTHGFQFVADENTKLYVVSGSSNVSEEVEASIYVNSFGFLVVDIDSLGEVANATLTLIIVNPKVAFDAPIAYGDSYELNVYGSALHSPMKNNLILLEGGEEGADDWSLPTEPTVDVHEWEAAATME